MVAGLVLLLVAESMKGIFQLAIPGMLDAGIESVSTGNVEPACEDLKLEVEKVYLVEIAGFRLELVDQSSMTVISIEDTNAPEPRRP